MKNNRFPLLLLVAGFACSFHSAAQQVDSVSFYRWAINRNNPDYWYQGAAKSKGRCWGITARYHQNEISGWYGNRKAIQAGPRVISEEGYCRIPDKITIQKCYRPKVFLLWQTETGDTLRRQCGWWRITAERILSIQNIQPAYRSEFRVRPMKLTFNDTREKQNPSHNMHSDRRWWRYGPAKRL